jgi:hypothetical protein
MVPKGVSENDEKKQIGLNQLKNKQDIYGERKKN